MDSTENVFEKLIESLARQEESTGGEKRIFSSADIKRLIASIEREDS